MRIINTKKDFEATSDLETYLKWVAGNVTISPWSIEKSHLTFFDNVVIYVIDRRGQFQTQLIAVQPNVIIPNHRHPNVDSFEIAMHGMTFTNSGRTIPYKIMRPGMSIYVDHNDFHGGSSSDAGGCFLSVQQWLNDIPPTSVETDWSGDTMGPLHDFNIDSK